MAIEYYYCFKPIWIIYFEKFSTKLGSIRIIDLGLLIVILDATYILFIFFFETENLTEIYYDLRLVVYLIWKTSIVNNIIHYSFKSWISNH